MPLSLRAVARAALPAVALGVALAPCRLVPCASAADAPAAPPAATPAAPERSPAQRLRDARAALPAPAPARAFVFDADVWLGEARFGVARYAASVLAPEGDAPARWKVVEHARTEGGPRAQVHDTTAILDARLRMVSYERSVRVEGEPAARTKAAFTETGELRVVRTDPDGAETVTTDEGPTGPGGQGVATEASATVAGILLLLREARLTPGVYELPLFVHESGTVETARLEVVGPARLAFRAVARDAVLTRFAVGDFGFDLYLDPVDLAPLAVRSPARGVTFLAKALGAAEDADPIRTQGPAASARECGARLALGLLTSDLDLVTEVIDWAAYHAASRTRGLVETELVKFKAMALEALAQIAGETPRGKADAVVRGAVAAAVEAPDEDGVVVELGVPLSGIRYRAREGESGWKIVDFPGPAAPSAPR